MLLFVACLTPLIFDFGWLLDLLWVVWIWFDLLWICYWLPVTSYALWWLLDLMSFIDVIILLSDLILGLP